MPKRLLQIANNFFGSTRIALTQSIPPSEKKLKFCCSPYIFKNSDANFKFNLFGFKVPQMLNFA